MIFTAPEMHADELRAVERIDELRKQVRWGMATPRRWLGGLRRLAFARAVQASNSIEDYDASLDDVIAAVEDEEPLDAKAETFLALQGYRDAMTYVLQLAQEEDVEIKATLLKAPHFMMMKYDLHKRPGRWRLGSIYVTREPENEVVYEAPDADIVPVLVDELDESLKDGSIPVLVRAAMAHLNLVMIHPFADGNGRMARCLQTMVLTRERILDPVFCSIEEYLGRNTEAYYDMLAHVGQGSWHPENNARPWIRFCLNAHFQQAQTTLRRIQETEQLWGRCQELASRYGLPERAVGALSDAARGLRVRSPIYRVIVRDSEGSEIDGQTASRDLHLMVQCGLLAAQGATRGRFYMAAPALRLEYEQIRRVRPRPGTANLFRSSSTEQLELALPLS